MDAFADKLDALEAEDRDSTLQRARHLMVSLVETLPEFSPWVQSHIDDVRASPEDGARRKALANACRAERDRLDDQIVHPLDPREAPATPTPTEPFDLARFQHESAMLRYVELTVADDRGLSVYAFIMQLVAVLPARVVGRLGVIARAHFPG